MSEDILAGLIQPKEVVPADQPVVAQTEEERREQEAREYLASLPQRRQATPEEIEAERQQTLAGVPMINGLPIPENGTLTQEQLRNNPSNYQPAIEEFVAKTGEIAVATVTREQPTTAADTRQQWVCVTSDGIRTLDPKGGVHPPFGSDAHLMDMMVRCPRCNSASVRKVMPGEDLAEDEKRAQWMHDRTKVMGLNPRLS